MFVVLKNKLNIILCYILVFTLLFVANSVTSIASVATSPSNKFCVVLDAGHGGVDGGCVGSTGVTESEITLKIAKKVEKYLDALNISVVQTRNTADGLYGVFASGFKMRDLRAREEIIKKANPDLLVSIHLNSYTSPSSRGAQVFYAKDSEVSKELANSLQELFQKNLVQARKSALVGDYYILNCTNTPGILVECGFLSNPEEEALLISDEYQDKIAYNITCGVLNYFELTQF